MAIAFGFGVLLVWVARFDGGALGVSLDLFRLV